MCFSSGASFASAAILGVAGVASLRLAKDKSERMYAAIPLVFGTQQLVEGCVWMALNAGEAPAWRADAILLFLLFAQVIWPVWVPVSLWMKEKQRSRKVILTGFALLGIAVSIFLVYCFLNYPVDAETASHHIRYIVEFPVASIPWIGIFYLLPTTISCFISTNRYTVVIGILLSLSYFVSRIWFKETLVSVWCYFAAIISLVVYLDFRKKR